MHLNLTDLYDTKLNEKLAQISQDETEIDLSNNDLVTRSGVELNLIFKSLPKKLNKLNLANNNLQHAFANTFLHNFALLNLEIESIDLSNNGLGCLPLGVFVAVFKALPQRLKQLALDNNQLGAQQERLLKGLSLLPASLQELSLKFNELRQLNVNSLSTLKNVIQHLKIVHFEGNGLTEKYLQELNSTSTPAKVNETSSEMPSFFKSNTVQIKDEVSSAADDDEKPKIPL